MKSIAIVLAAGAALSVGGCSKTTQDNAAATFNSASSDAEAAGRNAAADVDTATDNLGAKTDAALDSAGNHAAIAADKAAAWAGNAMQATGDAIHNAGSDLKK